MVNDRSPLRYPGGKTRAAKRIVNAFPRDITHIYSPFFGGGSVELEAVSRGIRVTGSDLFEPLVCFWQNLLTNKNNLADTIESYLAKMDRSTFYSLQTELRSLMNPDGILLKRKSDCFKSAVLFFIINRSSFSGSTLSGGYSPRHERFTKASVQRIRDFKPHGFTVNHKPWERALYNIKKGEFVYLDPPYMIEKYIYGTRGSLHAGFDHTKLAAWLRELDARGVKWLVSYNDSPKIRKLYAGYNFTFPKWSYGMSTDKASREIQITN